MSIGWGRVLDNDATSHDDLLNAFRISLMVWQRA
jgi:hypothetical protein